MNWFLARLLPIKPIRLTPNVVYWRNHLEKMRANWPVGGYVFIWALDFLPSAPRTTDPHPYCQAVKPWWEDRRG